MRSISKVFVAAAVAGACGYGSAATISVGTATYSGNNAIALESVQSLATSDAIALGTVQIVLGGPYSLNDQIEVSVAGASFGSTGLQSANFTCSSAGNNSTAFTLVTASSTSSTLIYAASAPTGLTAGQTCSIPTVQVTAGSISAAGDVSLTSVSKKAATLASFDTGAAANVASVASVYSITSTTVFDGVIDVQDDRLTFASNNDAAGLLGGEHDVMAISLNRASTHTMIASVVGSMVITLTAGSSFNFLAEPGTTTCDFDGTGSATASTTGAGATITANTACSVLTVNIPTVAAGLYQVALGRDGAVTTATASALVEQGYTAAVSANIFETRVSTVNATPAAGAWTINGTTVNIPYMPRNANIDLVVNIANRSTQTGEVTFSAWNADGTLCTGSLGNVGANANMSVGAALKTALLACDGAGWATATRATVQIVSPTPASTTLVNSSFSLSDGKSRQLVINSTN